MRSSCCKTGRWPPPTWSGPGDDGQTRCGPHPGSREGLRLNLIRVLLSGDGCARVAIHQPAQPVTCRGMRRLLRSQSDCANDTRPRDAVFSSRDPESSKPVGGQLDQPSCAVSCADRPESGLLAGRPPSMAMLAPVI
ncbi:MAG: hypothetical protein QOJ56_3144 [Mycobacterium sp.]|jgi:hypothetical protein|nr:hypothetical protein [Mycobacterium sp.]